MCESLLESFLFILLVSLKLVNIHIFTKQGYDMFHIRQLVKAVLLLLVLFYSFVKFLFIDVDSSHLMTSLWNLVISVVVITAAMLLSRLIALIFLKQ